MFTRNLICSAQIYIVGLENGVVIYYYLKRFNILMYPSIDSDISKCNVQINQHCPCLNVLPIVMFPSSLPSASHEEFKSHSLEIVLISG